MNEVVRYVSVAVNVSKRWALDVAVTINELNLAVKIYLLLVHIFFLALLVVIVKRKTKSRVVTARERTRTVRVADRAVTIESCDWLNSTLQWLFQNSVTGRTPDLIRLWIRALNRQLLRDRKVFIVWWLIISLNSIGYDCMQSHVIIFIPFQTLRNSSVRTPKSFSFFSQFFSFFSNYFRFFR